MNDDIISRQAAIDAVESAKTARTPDGEIYVAKLNAEMNIRILQSAQPERYTKEELRVFQHGISLSLLSKRSAQHWQYDEDRATEIKFLERLYEKVCADIRGEEV